LYLALLVTTVFPKTAFSQADIHYALPPGAHFVKPKGRFIIGLYDSSEKDSENQNNIKLHLESDLKALGFKVVYHDIHKGLPPQTAMQEARAVISWYRDPKMKDAAHYCHWLKKLMRSGKKVVVMDNFGAYQDMATGKWLDLNTVNETFEELGVLYKASWTSDPEKLSIEYQDNDVVGKVVPVDLYEVKHYYLYEKVGPGVKDYLRIVRKDMNQSLSSVIFSSPKGGMMLSNYFLVRDPRDGQFKLNVDFMRFMNECLDSPKRLKMQKTLVVWEENAEKESLKALRNICWTLWYAKIDYDLVEFKNLANFMPYNLKKYSALILYARQAPKLTEELILQNLRNYVQEGGGFVVMRHIEIPFLSDLFGIEEKRSENDLKAEGLYLSESFLPGAQFLSYSEDDLSTGALDVRLSSSTVTLGKALTKNDLYPKGIPIVWLNSYGLGRVVYWNANYLGLISMRGVLLYSLLWSQPIAVYSIVNIESVMIDDCPQPVYNTYKEPIRSTLNLTDTDFYLNVWWNDIEELSRKYGLHYTFYAIFNYDAKREEPFDGKEFTYGKNHASAKLGRRILAHNFELGLHGYNHQPLVNSSEKFTNWKDLKSMKKSLQAAKDLWAQVFPDAESVFSYAAPMNAIDAQGKAALCEVFPSIRVLSTVLDDLEEEGASVLEFGTDKDEPRLFSIPRLTSGYVLSQGVKNYLIGGLAVFGVWTHFIHPDDVFDRYGMTMKLDLKKKDWKWEEVRNSMDSMFAFVRTHYPWLRDMSVRDAYYELKKYFEEKRKVEFAGDTVVISFSGGTASKKYFAVKVNNGSAIGKLQNCRLLHAYAASGVFLFETEWNVAKIRLTR